MQLPIEIWAVLFLLVPAARAFGWRAAGPDGSASKQESQWRFASPSGPALETTANSTRPEGESIALYVFLALSSNIVRRPDPSFT